MILDKEVNIIGNAKIISHYKLCGYNMIIGTPINIKVENLTFGSNVKINCQCDVCDEKTRITYQTYKANFNNGGYYCCSEKCSRKKAEQTCLNKYGVEHALQNKFLLEKSQETSLKNWGTKHPSQNEKIKIKILETCLKNFGVKYPMQDSSIHEKAQLNGKKIKTHKQTKLKYRGTYEKHFLDYCFNNGIKIEKSKSIKYEFENKKRVYHPDFYYASKNLIIEIKSAYTLNDDYEENLAKQKACIEQGYCFIFIIDKNYDEFFNQHIYQ